MRKRFQYKNNKIKTRIPTIIIMCIALFLILFFGKQMSWSIAGFFAPNVPVTDAEVAVSDMPNTGSNMAEPAPSKTGTVISSANKSAAQKLLSIIAAK